MIPRRPESSTVSHYQVSGCGSLRARLPNLFRLTYFSPSDTCHVRNRCLPRATRQARKTIAVFCFGIIGRLSAEIQPFYQQTGKLCVSSRQLAKATTHLSSGASPYLQMLQARFRHPRAGRKADKALVARHPDWTPAHQSEWLSFHDDRNRGTCVPTSRCAGRRSRNDCICRRVPHCRIWDNRRWWSVREACQKSQARNYRSECDV